MIIERILAQARAMGACSKVQGVEDADALVELFFSPQGREFCIGRDYPNMPDWRMLRTSLRLAEHGIYVDYGHVGIESGGQYGLIGKVSAEVKLSGGSSLIVLMHGANAEVTLSRYAVVRIERTPDCEVKIINKDNTGVVLW